MRLTATSVLAAICLIGTSASAQQQQQAPQEPLGFFITSAVPGSGNLGGLEGADQICQDLAAAVGAGDRTWRAYLSTQATDSAPAVNARDRIGSGPWHNAQGTLIAANVADLHGDVERDRNNIFKDTALDESGNLVSGRGDQPNQHDILTGSDSHGNAWPAGEDRTCMNWTSDSPDARGWVGHHDRQGGGNTSWNSVHLTRGGCHAEGLQATGGSGRFYCFAAD
jgi:hypothetical protein